MIKSISDIYYKIGRWFTVILCAIAFLALPFALDKNPCIWAFMMCAGLAFVGAACNYKDRFEYPIHYGGAIISMIGCVIYALTISPWSLLGLLASLISIFDRQRWLLWVEIGFVITGLIAIA